jgi:hypothetical protein
MSVPLIQIASDGTKSLHVLPALHYQRAPPECRKLFFGSHLHALHKSTTTSTSSNGNTAYNATKNLLQPLPLCNCAC